ncbi:MAG: outer membrane beta-barrel protein, partial [Fermentimonas sp.]|nr:outer membrane beta-barrel protein [Fermentimonas sp.]
MKKIRLFLVLAMFAVATAVSAQVSLGVKGGVNMSNFYGEELDNENVKIGFNVGLLADYEFSYNSAIQTGLFFTTKGFKYDSQNLDYTENL